MKLERGMRALVTGASSGIGAELAERLAQRGVTVGVVARRAGKLAEVLARCQLQAPGSRSWVVDLGDLDAATALAEQAWDELGPLDVVVHNAGIPKRRHVTELTAGEVDEVLRVNYLAPVRMTLVLLPKMLERGRGSTVYVSSLAGRLGVPKEAAYSASKFALCGWAEGMRIDLDGSGVEVKLILPGAIDTEIWDLAGNDPPLYEGPKEPAGPVAAGIIDAIESEHFEHYLPDLKAVAEFKVHDIDGYLAGAAQMASQAKSAQR